MKAEFENKCLSMLSELERSHQVVERFGALGSSSWVLLKNVIFERSLSHLAFSKAEDSSLFSLMTLRLIGMSLWHYMARVARFAPQDLFVGAGSGVFQYQGEMLDSYLPAELASAPGRPATETLYLLSANHVKKMWGQAAYLQRHQAVVYSFLVAPIRFLLGRLLALFLPLNRHLLTAAREVSTRLSTVSVDMSPGEILRLHARFCAGYLIYRVLLSPLRIRRAFVVSAYSNSELCAVLRKMGVEIVEVQHGGIGPTHRGYNYAVQSILLPTPHRVSVYSSLWRDELLAAGYFSVDRIVISQRLKYALAEAETSAFDFPYIVLTGQGILVEQIANFVADYATLDSHLHLVYVPHPTEGVDYIARIKAAAGDSRHIHIIERPVVTTERLIIDCVAHLSVYSSCHFDAVHYKGRTFVLDFAGDNPMHYYTQRSNDTFVSVTHGAELLRHLGEVF